MVSVRQAQAPSIEDMLGRLPDQGEPDALSEEMLSRLPDMDEASDVPRGTEDPAAFLRQPSTSTTPAQERSRRVGSGGFEHAAAKAVGGFSGSIEGSAAMLGRLREKAIEKTGLPRALVGGPLGLLVDALPQLTREQAAQELQRTAGVETNPAREGDFFGSQIPEALGGTAGFFTQTAALGPFGALAGLGSKAGQFAAGAATGALGGSEEAYERTLADTGDETRAWKAALVGGLFGTTEAADVLVAGGLGRFGRKIAQPAARLAKIDRKTGGLFKDVVLGSALEGFQEASQGLVQEFFARRLDDEDRSFLQDVKDSLPAAGQGAKIGFAIGGLLGGGGAAVRGLAGSETAEAAPQGNGVVSPASGEADTSVGSAAPPEPFRQAELPKKAEVAEQAAPAEAPADVTLEGAPQDVALEGAPAPEAAPTEAPTEPFQQAAVPPKASVAERRAETRGSDRRQDLARRKTIDEMDQEAALEALRLYTAGDPLGALAVMQKAGEERSKALRFSAKARGLKSGIAFKEEVQEGDLETSADIDNFKRINDVLGHEAGDEAIGKLGEAFKAEAAEKGYHLSGDEFALRPKSIEEAEEIMARVQKRADDIVIERTLPNGEHVKIEGIKLSWGHGKYNEAATKSKTSEAETNLKASKAAKKAAGLRVERGEEHKLTGGITRTKAGEPVKTAAPKAEAEPTVKRALALAAKEPAQPPPPKPPAEEPAAPPKVEATAAEPAPSEEFSGVAGPPWQPKYVSSEGAKADPAYGDNALGRAARIDPDTGDLLATHVTDDPASVIRALEKGDLIAGREGKFGDIGPGLYGSDIPETWMSRSRGKWSFLEGLAQDKRRAIVDEVYRSSAFTEPGYVTADEKAAAKRDLERWVEDPRSDYAITSVAGQPFNVQVWTPDFLKRVGVAPGRSPKAVPMRLRGKFIHAEEAPELRNFTEGDISHLREQGYVGAFQRQGMVGTGQIVVWDPKAVVGFGDWKASDKPPPRPTKATPPPVEPPSKETPTPDEPKPFVTSTKNRIVEQERAERGLDPLEKAERQSNPEAFDKAGEILEEDVFAGEKLLDQIKERPRALTPTENALVLREKIKLMRARNLAEDQLLKAQESGDKNAVDALTANAQKLSDRLVEIDPIIKSAGTESGRSLQARRMEADQDYSLARLETRARIAAGGRKLTPEEHENIRKHSERLLALEKAVAELEEAAFSGKPTSKPKPAGPRKGKLLTLISEQAEAARARIKARGPRAMAGLDPVDLADRVIIGAEYIANDIARFAEWSSAMVKEMGETIRPHLEDIYEKAKAHLRGEERKDTTTSIKEKIAAGKDFKADVAEIARGFVEDGVANRDELIDKVHEALKEANPGITRREVMDAISGYGEFRQIAKDEVSAKLRDLKGQMQQVAKLEDLEKRLAPKKTGVERRIPSQEERTLIKQVNELKKKLGLDVKVTDPETQLRGALDSIKTRLRNQITDLQVQINKREKLVKGKAPSPSDAEVVKLKAERDALQEQFDAIFPKGPTPPKPLAERVRLATEAVEKSIADLEKRVAAEDVAPKPGAKPVSTPELEALRARRDALQGELDWLRRMSKEKPDPEEMATKAYKSRLANRVAREQERAFYASLPGFDFAKKQKRAAPMDPETIKLQTDLEQAKRSLARDLNRFRLKNRTTGQKIAGAAREIGIDLPKAVKTTLDWSAVFRQGLFYTASHPIRTAKSLPEMFAATFSERKAAEIETKIRNRPLAEVGRRAGLELTSLDDDLSKGEEAIRSKWSDKIPTVRASNRGYITFLNMQRATAFDAMWNALPPDQQTHEKAKVFANMANVATGRGQAGRFAQYANTAGAFLWSPRLLLSRIQLLAGQPLYKSIREGDAATTKIIAKEYARSLIAMGAFYSLAHLAGWEWEKDPRSSDFMKLRPPDDREGIRLDPLGGLSQVSVLETRTARQAFGSITGEDKPKSVLPLEGGKPREMRPEDWFYFLRTKFSPTAGAATNLVFGKDIRGQEVTPGSLAKDLYMPMTFENVYDAMQAEGVENKVALTLMSIFGMGLARHEKRRKKAG